jgi:GntR family transcriptional repressor for pyruvate dehydrogenase complex
LIKKTLLCEQIADLICSSIITGEYCIGDQLPTESALAKEFGVSRTVIREAMKSLKEKGMVETKAAKGTFVTCDLKKGIGDSLEMLIRKIPEESFWNTIEIRKSFEPEIAAIAAEKAIPEDIKKLENCLQEMQKCLADKPYSEENLYTFSKLDLLFHSQLIESTQNSLLILLMKSLLDQIQNQQLTHILMNPQASQIFLREHIQIFEAVKEKDITKARESMKKHISNVEGDFRSLEEKIGKEDFSIIPQ